MIENKFEEVSEYEFATYIEDIKNKLKDKYPEWHVNIQRSPNTLQLFYHLCQWDFTHGKRPYDNKLKEFIFAYEEEGKYYILNHHPIVENKQ